MKFPVVWLWIVSAFFVTFGIGFIVAPIELARITTGTAPTGASAIMDMRAAHGGAPLGLGIFMGFCAYRRRWVRPGLMVSLLTSAGLSTSRFAGVIVDGSPTPPMIASLVTEVAFVVLSAIGLRQVSRSSQDAG